jgi:hypothetical protein
MVNVVLMEVKLSMLALLSIWDLNAASVNFTGGILLQLELPEVLLLHRDKPVTGHQPPVEDFIAPVVSRKSNHSVQALNLRFVVSQVSPKTQVTVDRFHPVRDRRINRHVP